MAHSGGNTEEELKGTEKTAGLPNDGHNVSRVGNSGLNITNDARFSHTIRHEQFLEKFMAGKFGTSILHEHFTYLGSIPNGENLPSRKVVLECKHCGATKYGDNSSNFDRHINKMHPTKKLKSKLKKRPLDEFLNLPISIAKKKRVAKVASTSIQQRHFKEFLVDLVTVDGLPFSITEGWAMRRMIEYYVPQINLPSRRTLVRDLEKAVNGINGRIKEVMKSVPAKTLHLTLDLWSSRNRESVLCVRGHFINDEWAFQNVLLGFERFSGRHTGESILANVKGVLRGAGINIGQIMCICADNASNMIKAFNLNSLFEDEWLLHIQSGAIFALEAQEDEEGDTPEHLDYEFWSSMNTILGVEPVGHIVDSEFADDDTSEELNVVPDPSWKRKGCVAHSLQLVINASIKKDADATAFIKTINDIIGFFRKSLIWTEELKKRTDGRDLIPLGGTRWNVLFYAIERISEPNMIAAVKAVIIKAKKEKDLSIDFPTLHTGMVEEAKEMLHLLKPLKDTTDRLQSNGIIAPEIIGELLQAFDKVYECRAIHFNLMRDEILNQMETRFSNTVLDVDFVTSTLLDPRQKLAPFDEYFSNPSWGERYQRIKCPMKSKAKDIVSTLLLKESNVRTAVDAQVSKKRSGKLGYLTRVPSPMAPNGPAKELDIYLAEDLLRYPSADEDDDGIPESQAILDYWRDNAKRFPHLSNLARCYLSIPISSADVERSFSMAGNYQRARRANLSLKHVANILTYTEYRTEQIKCMTDLQI